MAKAKKTNSKKELHKKLWKITSQLVRSQSCYCYTCGNCIPEIGKRHTGHFWTKGGHQASKYELDNLRVQCDSCNRWKGGNLAEYSARLLNEIGSERIEALYKLAHTTKTVWTYEELELMIIERATLLKELEYVFAQREMSTSRNIIYLH